MSILTNHLLNLLQIIHFAENINTLFVHGGVHPNIGKTYLNKGKESVDKLNSVWREHSTEEKLFDFLSGSSTEGQVVYSLLTHRGNHPGYSKWESHGHVDDDPKDKDVVCMELEDMLADIPGVDRIAVGHTPLLQSKVFSIRLNAGKGYARDW